MAKKGLIYLKNNAYLKCDFYNYKFHRIIYWLSKQSVFEAACSFNAPYSFTILAIIFHLNPNI